MKLKILPHKDCYCKISVQLRQGKEETRREIAKQFLDVLDEETISRKTGLSLEEVRQFKIDELTDE